MVAAGYCMYGSSSNLVISMGHGVNGYTLDNVGRLSAVGVRASSQSPIHTDSPIHPLRLCL